MGQAASLDLTWNVLLAWMLLFRPDNIVSSYFVRNPKDIEMSPVKQGAQNGIILPGKEEILYENTSHEIIPELIIISRDLAHARNMCKGLNYIVM